MSASENIASRASIELAGAEAAHEEQPDVAVVHAIDWRIEAGEWWVVYGGPGSGKTSLLSAAAGLTPPIGGSLRIFGQPYWDAAEPEQVALRRRLGFVFDGGGRLFSHMSVLENLTLPIQYHTDCDARTAQESALELLSQFGLGRYVGIAPSRLSPTLQRRVALARALTVPVEVLFLDSPLAWLGPEDARWWLGLLRGLVEQAEAQGRRMSVVASGYDLRRWLGWAHRFGELRDGHFRTLDETEAHALMGAEEGALASPGSS